MIQEGKCWLHHFTALRRLYLVRISQVTTPRVLSSSLFRCAHNTVATPDSLSKLIPSRQRASKGFGNYLLKPQALSRCHLLWQALPCLKKAALLPISFEALFVLQCSSQIWQCHCRLEGESPAVGMDAVFFTNPFYERLPWKGSFAFGSRSPVPGQVISADRVS